MRSAILRAWRVGRVLILSAVVVVTGGSAAWVAHAQTHPVSAAAPAAEPPKGEKITRLAADRFAVPDALAERLKVRTAVAAPPAAPSPLPPFQGTLAHDLTTFQRIRPRFGGEVVELGTAEVPRAASASTQPFSLVTRPLEVGDKVAAGQLLAVVWSKDLGEKKNQLVDAVTKLKADQLILDRLTDLYKQNATSERSVRDAEQAVRQDQSAVDTAERTLKVWRLSDAEIAAVRAEADKLTDPKAKRADAATWARVEVRAARAGTILEMNFNPGDNVTTDTTMFVVGDLSRLVVWAHVYEDDLPLLTDLPKPVRWTVTLPSRPGLALDGTLESVADVIDPNQHTALVKGKVDNPRGELKIGQFVTVTVHRPVHPNELAVPAEAVVEDGRQSVVFVRPDPAKSEYVRRPVTVARRTRDLVYLTAGVKDKDLVLTTGSLLLREAADALPAVH